MVINFGKNIYKLTKVKIKDEKSSYVNNGDSFVGQAYLNENNRLNLGGILTSQVEVLNLLDNGNWTVETKNSIYTMEKLD